MNINVSPEIILKYMLYVVFTLLCANSLGILSTLYFDHDNLFGLIPFFDFDKEMNIPTLYSSFTLMVASILLGFIAKFQRDQNEKFIAWLGLAFISFFNDR